MNRHTRDDFDIVLPRPGAHHQVRKSKKAAAYEKELVGSRYGYLTILAVTPTIWDPNRQKWGQRRAYCRCDCGETKLIRVHSLREGKTLSCGCYHAGPERGRKISATRKQSARVKLDSQRRAAAAEARRKLKAYSAKRDKAHARQAPGQRPTSSLL